MIIESWRHRDNAGRPDASIGYWASPPAVSVPALAASPAAQTPAPMAMLRRCHALP
jgi:hypothetical protein